MSSPELQNRREKLFVYVPGIEGTGKLFYKQAEHLAPDYKVVALPLRPHGRYSMNDLIADLRACVLDAGFESATVLGESFGGMLSMAAALAHPEIFERLILVNTFPFFANRRRINLGVRLFALAPFLLPVYRRRDGHRGVCGKDVSDEDRKLYGALTREVGTTGREGYVSRLRIIKETDLRARLSEIKIPTLVVAGTADDFLDSVTAAKLIAAKLPRARLKLIEGASHSLLLSDNERVRDWLAEFDGL